jgi:IS30 family transposase
LGYRVVVGKKSHKAAVTAIFEKTARSQIAVEPVGRNIGAMDAAAGEIAGSIGEASGDAVERAVYFRHPHSSFEKGINERYSGLLRLFVEKEEARTGTATFPGNYWVK